MPPRRPVFAVLSAGASLLTLAVMYWPASEAGTQFMDATAGSFNLAGLILGLLIWAGLVTIGQGLGLLLLMPALWRRERPLIFLALAALFQVLISGILWGDELITALKAPF